MPIESSMNFLISIKALWFKKLIKVINSRLVNPVEKSRTGKKNAMKTLEIRKCRITEQTTKDMEILLQFAIVVR
jgi:hypothetical protein